MSQRERRYHHEIMSGARPSTFLPDGWPDLRAGLDALGLEATRLYRWEEQFTEEGERRRAAHLLTLAGEPGPEALAEHVVTRARGLGFRVAPSSSHDVGVTLSVTPAAEDPQAVAILLDEHERALTIATRPLPSRLLVALVEPRAWGGGMRVVPSPPTSEWARDPTLLPGVASLLGVVSRVARVRVARVDRFAERDALGGDVIERFFPPTLRATLRGTFALEAVCAVLADDGYEEDGDAWVKESRDRREEVRVREGEVDLAFVPGELAGVPIAPLSRTSKPPPVT
jgi:hypothetical protein